MTETNEFHTKMISKLSGSSGIGSCSFMKNLKTFISENKFDEAKNYLKQLKDNNIPYTDLAISHVIRPAAHYKHDNFFIKVFLNNTTKQYPDRYSLNFVVTNNGKKNLGSKIVDVEDYLPEYKVDYLFYKKTIYNKLHGLCKICNEKNNTLPILQECLDIMKTKTPELRVLNKQIKRRTFFLSQNVLSKLKNDILNPEKSAVQIADEIFQKLKDINDGNFTADQVKKSFIVREYKSNPFYCSVFLKTLSETPALGDKVEYVVVKNGTKLGLKMRTFSSFLENPEELDGFYYMKCVYEALKFSLSWNKQTEVLSSPVEIENFDTEKLNTLYTSLICFINHAR